VDALLSVTIAPACAACKRPLEQPTTGPVCASCWSAITPLKPPLCRTCGGMLPSWRTIDQATGRCASCRRRGPSAVDAGSTAGNYEGVLREIVHAFKYEGRRSLAPHLGALMRTAGRELLDGASCVVPVPLYPWRRFSRGFNQASDLARTLHLPVVHALWRSRATASQTGLTASARRRNVRGAFRLSPWVTRRSRDAMLLDRVVVLVDDVRTTGATLEACAKTLKEAGVREVRALTAVRADTPSHRPRIISI
jgi:ComF family protein